MPKGIKDDSQEGSVFRAGRDIRAGRDLAGGDIIAGDVSGGDMAGGDIAGGDIAGGDIIKDSAAKQLELVFEHWRTHMDARIEAHPELSLDEKKDLKEQVARIKGEAVKAGKADPSRLEKLINTLSIMAPDIFAVAVTTLANPLSGIGLALKKIGEKASLEKLAA